MRSFLVLALLMAPAALPSQQPAPQSGHAVLTGVAVDSVRGGYLGGAIVSVSGTTLSAITNSIGRFRVDSVPAGQRYLEMMHPLLDSMSLKVRTAPRDFVAGETMSFILSIPSPATIVATKCNADDRARGAAAVVGTVMDADTEAPSTGATVTVEWTEYQLGRRSMNRLPQRRTGTVRADGTYRVCGVPDDLTTGVMALRGTDSTAVIPVNFSNRLAVVSFHLPAGAAAAPVAQADSASANRTRAARGSATVTGKVVDASGAPLANTRVAVEADDAGTITDNQGVFRITGLRTGTRSLTVRRLGFASTDVRVDVSATNTRNVIITLARYVAVLDAVRITAMREVGLQRVGFTDRKQRASAGKFFGPDEIARRNPQRLINLLETVSSLRMGTNADSKRYVTGRQNGCVRYFVDGLPWYTSSETDIEMSPDAFLSGAELGAVEVYDEMFAPGGYMRTSNRGEPCAVVVIWTRAKLGN